MSSNLTVWEPIAMSDANKNVAENVPRLILFAMLASVSFRPHFFSRSANSRYPTSARADARHSASTVTTPATALMAPAICGETLKRPGSLTSTSLPFCSISTMLTSPSA
jgi:hypothetical protein